MTQLLSDRGITTLAILKVNHDRDRTFLGNYLPFVYHCLSETSADVVSSPELQSTLEQGFDVKLPLAVIKRLLGRASSAGMLRRENGVYVVQHERLQGSGLTATREAVERGYRQLLDRLIEFAHDFAPERLEMDWSLPKADELVSTYIDRFSSGVLACALHGKVPPPAPRTASAEEYVLHRFVAHVSERDQQIFEFLETVVKGRMLADALYYETDPPKPPGRLDDLQVYLDGPLLLDILGYGGPEIQAPYLELLEMLKRQGASPRCFTHNASEAQGVLDAAVRRIWSGQASDRPNDAVFNYLVRSGKTRSDIELSSDRIQRDLLRHGIQTVDAPEQSRAASQPDEMRLEMMLQRGIEYENDRARTRDVDSLLAIERLRGGRVYRDLAKSDAVFVTRNYELFRVSAHFFEPRGMRRVVPHCLFHTAFTVLVWLQEPLATPNLPRERIIADAFAALNPDDDLWEAYNDEIDRLKSADSLSDDDLSYLRFADEARVSLMDITCGNAEVFTEGTLLEVLERARETVRSELRTELEAERARQRQRDLDIARSHKRIARVAATAAQAVSAAVFAVLVSALVLGVVFGPYGPIHHDVVPAPIQLMCTIFAVTFLLWISIHRGSLTNINRALSGRLTTWTTAILLRLFQLPAQEPAEPLPDGPVFDHPDEP